MPRIAVTHAESVFLSRLREAYPAAQLRVTGIAEVERTAAEEHPTVLVVDQATYRDAGVARVATLKARFPELAVIAVHPGRAARPEELLALGSAQVDALLEDFEDHPETLRRTVSDAALSAASHVVADAYRHHVPAFAAPNVLGTMTQLRRLTSPKAFATALGQPVSSLAAQLRRGRLPPIRRTLAWCRATCGAARTALDDCRAEALAFELGYGGVRAFYAMFQTLLDATPTEVGARGGLWYAASRFRDALQVSAGRT